MRKSLVHHSLDGMFAIRKGDWKLILGLGSGGFSQPARVEPEVGQHSGQLYNLREDPGEQNNLYQQHSEIVAELTEDLEGVKAAGRSRP